MKNNRLVQALQVASLITVLVIPAYAATTTGAVNTVSSMADTPLIPRAALFGNPVKSSAQLSPDGKWLSWMAPVNGVMNVWVAPVDKPDAAKAITESKDRPIPQHFWSGNSEQVLFVKDNAGDENFRLYGVNVNSGKQQDFTPFEKVRVRMMGGSRKRLDEVLVGINNRDPRWHDVHLLNLKTGVLSRNRRKFRQPINVACPAPGRWGRPNSRVTSRHFDHGNASRTSRPDCSGLDEAD